ncbi:repetitive organellar protein-like [Macrobrachium rosenbergii]|uniref:repetitive organellar protein-like n=1 Tax=Macrobrachium rosenbergii TaxID=79674 RepID=UPI0034D62C01
MEGLGLMCSACESLQKKLKSAREWNKFYHQKLQNKEKFLHIAVDYEREKQRNVELQLAYDQRTRDSTYVREQMTSLLLDFEPLKEKLRKAEHDAKEHSEQREKIEHQLNSLQFSHEQLQHQLKELKAKADYRLAETLERKLQSARTEIRRLKLVIENKTCEIDELRKYQADRRLHYERINKRSFWSLRLAKTMAGLLTEGDLLKRDLMSSMKRMNILLNVVDKICQSQYLEFCKREEKKLKKENMLLGALIPSFDEWLDDFDRGNTDNIDDEAELHSAREERSFGNRSADAVSSSETFTKKRHKSGAKSSPKDDLDHEMKDCLLRKSVSHCAGNSASNSTKRFPNTPVPVRETDDDIISAILKDMRPHDKLECLDNSFNLLEPETSKHNIEEMEYQSVFDGLVNAELLVEDEPSLSRGASSVMAIRNLSERPRILLSQSSEGFPVNIENETSCLTNGIGILPSKTVEDNILPKEKYPLSVPKILAKNCNSSQSFSLDMENGGVAVDSDVEKYSKRKCIELNENGIDCNSSNNIGITGNVLTVTPLKKKNKTPKLGNLKEQKQAFLETCDADRISEGRRTSPIITKDDEKKLKCQGNGFMERKDKDRNCKQFGVRTDMKLNNSGTEKLEDIFGIISDSDDEKEPVENIEAKFTKAQVGDMGTVEMLETGSEEKETFTSGKKSGEVVEGSCEKQLQKVIIGDSVYIDEDPLSNKDFPKAFMTGNLTVCTKVCSKTLKPVSKLVPCSKVKGSEENNQEICQEEVINSKIEKASMQMVNQYENHHCHQEESGTQMPKNSHCVHEAETSVDASQPPLIKGKKVQRKDTACRSSGLGRKSGKKTCIDQRPKLMKRNCDDEKESISLKIKELKNQYKKMLQLSGKSVYEGSITESTGDGSLQANVEMLEPNLTQNYEKAAVGRDTLVSDVSSRSCCQEEVNRESVPSVGSKKECSVKEIDDIFGYISDSDEEMMSGTQVKIEANTVIAGPELEINNCVFVKGNEAVVCGMSKTPIVQKCEEQLCHAEVGTEEVKKVVNLVRDPQIFSKSETLKGFEKFGNDAPSKRKRNFSLSEEYVENSAKGDPPSTRTRSRSANLESESGGKVESHRNSKVQKRSEVSASNLKPRTRTRSSSRIASRLGIKDFLEETEKEDVAICSNISNICTEAGKNITKKTDGNKLDQTDQSASNTGISIGSIRRRSRSDRILALEQKKKAFQLEMEERFVKSREKLVKTVSVPNSKEEDLEEQIPQSEGDIAKETNVPSIEGNSLAAKETNVPSIEGNSLAAKETNVPSIEGNSLATKETNVPSIEGNSLAAKETNVPSIEGNSLAAKETNVPSIEGNPLAGSSSKENEFDNQTGKLSSEELLKTKKSEKTSRVSFKWGRNSQVFKEPKIRIIKKSVIKRCPRTSFRTPAPLIHVLERRKTSVQLKCSSKVTPSPASFDTDQNSEISLPPSENGVSISIHELDTNKKQVSDHDHGGDLQSSLALTNIKSNDVAVERDNRNSILFGTDSSEVDEELSENDRQKSCGFRKRKMKQRRPKTTKQCNGKLVNNAIERVISEESTMKHKMIRGNQSGKSESENLECVSELSSAKDSFKVHEKSEMKLSSDSDSESQTHNEIIYNSNSKNAKRRRLIVSSDSDDEDEQKLKSSGVEKENKVSDEKPEFVSLGSVHKNRAKSSSIPKKETRKVNASKKFKSQFAMRAVRMHKKSYYPVTSRPQYQHIRDEDKTAIEDNLVDSSASKEDKSPEEHQKIHSVKNADLSAACKSSNVKEIKDVNVVKDASEIARRLSMNMRSQNKEKRTVILLDKALRLPQKNKRTFSSECNSDMKNYSMSENFFCSSTETVFESPVGSKLNEAGTFTPSGTLDSCGFDRGNSHSSENSESTSDEEGAMEICEEASAEECREQEKSSNCGNVSSASDQVAHPGLVRSLAQLGSLMQPKVASKHSKTAKKILKNVPASSNFVEKLFLKQEQKLGKKTEECKKTNDTNPTLAYPSKATETNMGCSSNVPNSVLVNPKIEIGDTLHTMTSGCQSNEYAAKVNSLNWNSDPSKSGNVSLNFYGSKNQMDRDNPTDIKSENNISAASVSLENVFPKDCEMVSIKGQETDTKTSLEQCANTPFPQVSEVTFLEETFVKPSRIREGEERQNIDYRLSDILDTIIHNRLSSQLWHHGINELCSHKVFDEDLNAVTRAFIKKILQADPFEKREYSGGLPLSLYKLYQAMTVFERRLSVPVAFIRKKIMRSIHKLITTKSCLRPGSLACLTGWFTASAMLPDEKETFNFEWLRSFLLDLLYHQHGAAHQAILSAVVTSKRVLIKHSKDRQITCLEKLIHWIVFHGEWTGIRSIRTNLMEWFLKHNVQCIPKKDPLVFIQDLMAEFSEYKDQEYCHNITTAIVVFSRWQGRHWIENKLLPTVRSKAARDSNSSEKDGSLHCKYKMLIEYLLLELEESVVPAMQDADDSGGYMHEHKDEVNIGEKK